ncbi:hypothetical protein BKA63DRAFT_58277 [Paraphoma chrysanthemicola]|nr:hypothetical protein BKA63DRAFT_58277 [Paraphoma chrysanthemicola]
MHTVSQCSEKLTKLIEEERQLITLNDLQLSVNLDTEMCDLVESADIALGGSNDFLNRIKSNLGLDRNIESEIDEATTDYNIAVCRAIGSKLMSSVPPELRDIVYAHLTPRSVSIVAHKENELSAWINDGPVICDVADPDFTYYTDFLNIVDNVVYPGNMCCIRALGREAMLDLMEYFYQNCKFSINNADNGVSKTFSAVALAKFLNGDSDRLGIAPRQLILKMAVHFHIDLNISDCAKWEENTVDLLEQCDKLKSNAYIELVFHTHFRWNSERHQMVFKLNERMSAVHSHLSAMLREGRELQMELRGHDYDGEVKETFAGWVRRIKQAAQTGPFVVDADAGHDASLNLLKA